jgi:lipopolysaccharide export LptBFGC system permease protein LptF
LGISTLFVFLQALTAGEFISDGLARDAKGTWTDVHGYIAYPVMVFALVAAIVAVTRLKHERGLAVATGIYLVATVAQWLLGHAVSTLGMDWVTPFHVMLAFVVWGLAVWLSVRSARLRRAG